MSLSFWISFIKTIT